MMPHPLPLPHTRGEGVDFFLVVGAGKPFFGKARPNDNI
jgi:hypothetical protein